jgi:hypothetical protein
VLRIEQVRHQGSDERLGDRLIKADRQGCVMVRDRCQLRWHEEVAPHPPHGCHHPFIKNRLAKLLAHQVSLKAITSTM